MTTFEATFWEAGGIHETTNAYETRSIGEAVQNALADAEGWAREHGTRWVLMSVVDERLNSPETLNRIAWFGDRASMPVA